MERAPIFECREAIKDLTHAVDCLTDAMTFDTGSVAAMSLRHTAQSIQRAVLRLEKAQALLHPATARAVA